MKHDRWLWLLLALSGLLVAWMAFRRSESAAGDPAQPVFHGQADSPEASKTASARSPVPQPDAAMQSPVARTVDSLLHLRFSGADGRLPSPVRFSLYDSGTAALCEIAGPSERESEPRYSGRTLPDGSAVFALAEGAYQVDVVGPYYISGDPTLLHTADGEEHVIRLAMGATLIGSVTDQAGRPIAGARVATALGGFAQKHPAPPENTRANYRIVQTDATGAYDIDGLVIGNTVYVAAGAPGYGTTRTASAEIHPGENHIAALALPMEALVRVVLRDATRALTPGDQLVLMPQDEFLLNVERRLSVGDDHQCVFTSLPSGDYGIGLRGERVYARLQTVRVESGASATVLLDVLPLDPIDAVVTDSKNNPLLGASVRVRSGTLSTTKSTDEDGRVSLGLVPDARSEVEVSARGYLPARRSVAPQDIVDRELRIALDLGAVLRLELGSRVANADSVRVECSFRGDEGHLPDHRIFDLVPRDGQVEFGGLAPGRAWGIVAVVEKRLMGAFDVTIPGEVGTSGPIGVRVDLVEAADIDGLVIGRDELPLAGANLRIVYRFGMPQAVPMGFLAASMIQSAETGAFHIPAVLQKEATLRVQADGYDSVDLDLTHEDPRNVVVKLGP